MREPRQPSGASKLAGRKISAVSSRSEATARAVQLAAESPYLERGATRAIGKENMQNEKRTEYATRETILKLLSDDEIARVSTAETAAHLCEGDEYVDLEVPDRGVQKALGMPTVPMGRVLPRFAVLEKTWCEIVALLAAHRVEDLRLPTN